MLHDKILSIFTLFYYYGFSIAHLQKVTLDSYAKFDALSNRLISVPPTIAVWSKFWNIYYFVKMTITAKIAKILKWG